ncbi:MAG: glycosyltransferase, partial [Patescibacteria group bacterium]
MQTTLGQKTGIGFYVDSLVNSLETIDKENEYLKLEPETTEDFRSTERFVWDQITVPRRALMARADLLHQPGFSAPVRHRMPVVVTVHDLIAIHFGRDIPFGSQLYFGRWMPFSYRFADHIIAVSEYTKRDMVEHLQIDPSKITAIPSAADDRFGPITDRSVLDPVTKKFNTGTEFLLHVGTINPRKNLEFLVRVFAKVRSKLDQSIKLVITGKKGWYYESLFK